MTRVIDMPLVEQVLKIVDAGLVVGVGSPAPGKCCVEAAITIALGEPFSDRPSCVSACVRQVKIALNDASWSSRNARARGMRRLAVVQLGTEAHFDRSYFYLRIKDLAEKLRTEMKNRGIYTMVPLRAANGMSLFNRLIWIISSSPLQSSPLLKKQKDELLRWIANEIVQILVDMKTPGSEFLYLAE